MLFLKGKVSLYREGLNYSFFDRERSVLVLKVSFLSEKLLKCTGSFLSASAHGTSWSFLKEMTSQDISASPPQSSEKGL